METFYKNIEQLTFHEETDSLILHGWCGRKNGKEEVFVLYGDDTELPSVISLERSKREDVAKAFSDMSGVEKPGFQAVISEISSLMEQYRELKVIVLSEGEREVLWRMSREALLEEREGQKLLYSLDIKEMITLKVLQLVGWALRPDVEEEVAITLEDCEGREIPMELNRVIRRDVQEELGLNRPGERDGFGIVVRGKIPNRLRLVYQAANSRRVQEIDVTDLLKEFDLRFQLKAALGPDQWKDNWNYLKEHGPGKFAEYAELKMKPYLSVYQRWYRGHRATRAELHKQRRTVFPYAPLISIVIPLYNTPIPFLRELLQSIREQTYGNWQLCLADASSSDEVQRFLEKNYKKERRITYERLLENKGISENTNSALRLAQGDYIIFCDHDDVLTPDALYEIVWAINKHKKPDALYTDEDKVDMEGTYYFDPNFKPDFNLYWLRGNNYICHIFAVKKELFEKVGELRGDYDGAQDFDFVLRCCEKADQVVHIPKVLYHWRCHAGSTAGNPESKAYAYEAGRMAVVAHYARQKVKATVVRGKNAGWYRTYYHIQGNPMISIIIPNKDHIEDLERCLASIDEKTFYQNYEILVVENNSEKEETFSVYQKLLEQYPRMRLLTWKEEFNFSAINNYAVEQARGEYVLFLNNDTEVISPEWIEEMLGICQQKEVGIVGAKLYYPDDTIQHAGVILGLGGVAGHIFNECDRNTEGYREKAVNVQNLSAVTGACLLMEKAFFQRIRGFDPAFPVAFNDIDLCLRTQHQGKLVVFTPFAELYHCESKTRGREDDSEEQKQRFREEEERFRKRWRKTLKRYDPYYSPNLSLKRQICEIGEYEREGRI